MKLQEVLLPHFVTSAARHGSEPRRTFQADREMTKIAKRLQIAPRPAAKIEYREGWLALDILQKRGDVLADVVLTRALPEIIGALVIMLQRSVRDIFQVARIQFHLAAYSKRFPIRARRPRPQRSRQAVAPRRRPPAGLPPDRLSTPSGTGGPCWGPPFRSAIRL